MTASARTPKFTDPQGNRYLQVPLSALVPDSTNPRTPIQESTVEAIGAMLEYEGESVYKLAKDILDLGSTSPAELMIVEQVGGKYVVKEGNRRLIALMLLRNPNLGANAMDTATKRRWARLAADPRVAQLPKTMTVVEAVKHEGWIDRRHMGDQGGIGIRSWDRSAQARRAMQQGRMDVTQATIEALIAQDAGRFQPIVPTRRSFSTLERLLENTHARKTIGIDVDRSGAVCFTKGDRSLAMLEAVLHQMRLQTKKEGRIDTRTLNTDDTIRVYVDNLDETVGDAYDRTPMTTRLPAVVPAVTEPARSSPSIRRPTGIRALLPRGGADRPAKIVDQLLKAEKHDMPDAALVMLRVYLELSIEAYARKHNLEFAGDIDPTATAELKEFRRAANLAELKIPKNISHALDRWAAQSAMPLEQRLLRAIEHMVNANLLDRKDARTIMRQVKEREVVAQLNDAVHRLSAVPRVEHTRHILEVLALVIPHLHA